jgi:hypothetical protein
MNIKLNNIAILLCISFINLNIQAQENKETTAILSKKTEYNRTHPFGDGFKIQLYNGSESRAYQIKRDYKSAFNEVAELSYESPEWKVRVGHFTTRLEADRALLAIKEKFKSAIVLETTIRR